MPVDIGRRFRRLYERRMARSARLEQDSRSEYSGRVTQKNLQEFLRVKPPTVNGIVERLEEKHLLTRSVSPGDGRCKLLHLTEEGRCFYQEFIAITEEVHRQAEQGFTREEVKLLQSLLVRVAENLSRETEETHT